MHYNIVSKKQYRGRNQVELMTKAKNNGYKSKQWGTFLQWKELNRQIIKGEHGISVFKGYGSFTDVKEKDGKKKIEINNRPLGFARIFNIEQTKGGTI